MFKCDTSKPLLDIEDIKKYIHDEELYIDVESWQRMKVLYTKENIIDVIGSAIVGGLIKLPLPQVSLEEAIICQKELMSYSTSIKYGKIFSRYEDNLDNIYFDESSLYNNASNYFHQHSRYMAEGLAHPSPYRTWNTYKSARSTVSALFSLDMDEVTPTTLHSCIAMRKYIASQFKPSIAKAIYDYFGAVSVVDPCSGWGDRLSGFYACSTAKSYYGVDPNSNLIDGYNKQIEEYNKLASKSVTMICDGAESDAVTFPTCDLVFTSPPYFCKEKYSTDAKQSYLMYAELSDWLNKFLFVVLDKSFNALVNGGHLVLNISDVYAHGHICNICAPMVEYAKSIGFTHVGTWGIKMAKRLNSESYKFGTFCEPLYVFEK